MTYLTHSERRMKMVLAIARGLGSRAIYFNVWQLTLDNIAGQAHYTQASSDHALIDAEARGSKCAYRVVVRPKE